MSMAMRSTRCSSARTARTARTARVAFGAEQYERVARGVLAPCASSSRSNRSSQLQASTSSSPLLAVSSRSRAASGACKAFKQGHVYFWGQQTEFNYTVAKLQIGLFGDVSKFQRELNRLALDPASEDLSRLLRESCMFISSNYQYCAYATTQLQGTDDIDEAERFFNGMTLEERARFKEETLVNIDGDLRTSAWPRTQSTSVTTADQWMCATFIVALDGNLKLPRLDSITALRDSLLQLGSLTADDIIALELLWTPQATGDSYTREELLADYPGLLTLL